MPSQPDVLAAGAVVLRKGGDVLLVHRPKYDDWSFPKGKLDRGEHVLAAAVREVAEETGLAVRLGVPLSPQRYRLANGRMKTVRYWIGRALDGDDVSGYVANAEIDEVRWVSVEKAERMLTRGDDRRTLREAVELRRKTSVLVVVRHARARSRNAWRADDRFRPLLKTGMLQAERLVPVLAAYDVRRLVSSSSARCVSTLVPYADASGRPIGTEDGLSEEDATPEQVGALVDGLLDQGKRTVLCTHRPVLPLVFAALGIEDPHLDLGEMVVVHHRHGEIVALESHHVR
jgi:8-oxo-dGTP pyrophosphatase MutT (NUDIX family)/phosphohistidine phosphatase SixA